MVNDINLATPLRFSLWHSMEGDYLQSERFVVWCEFQSVLEMFHKQTANKKVHCRESSKFNGHYLLTLSVYTLLIMGGGI